MVVAGLFFYMDDTSQSWSISYVGISELHVHDVFNTLQQIYDAKDVSIDTMVAAVGFTTLPTNLAGAWLRLVLKK